MSSVHAVILAGGRGSRLGGVRKGDLLIGKQRLLERVARGFSAISGQFLVSTGQHNGMVLPAGANSVDDAERQSLGPLAGLTAAARTLDGTSRDNDILVSVAVDTPFLPEDYISRLCDSLDAASYAAFGDMVYPTNAAWRLKPLREALERHKPDAGPRSLLQALTAKKVDWAQDLPSNPFVNANSLADLLALQRLALSNTR